MFHIVRAPPQKATGFFFFSQAKGTSFGGMMIQWDIISSLIFLFFMLKNFNILIGKNSPQVQDAHAG